MRKCVCVASRIAFACIVSGAAFAPVAAADLGGYPSQPEMRQDPGIYVPSLFSWNGFYLGGHLGYSGGGSSSRNAPNSGNGDAFDGAYNKLSVSPYGWLGGAQGGYNWQFDSFVFGLEGELGYLGAEERKTAASGFVSADYGAYGTAAARLGYSDSRWLFYAKGGLALANIENKAGAITGGVVDTTDYTKLDEVRTGWTAGGGVEFAFQKNWSMKLEYLYMDFGEENSTNLDGDIFKHENSLHTVKVGINYLLQQPVEQLR